MGRNALWLNKAIFSSVTLFILLPRVRIPTPTLISIGQKIENCEIWPLVRQSHLAKVHCPFLSTLPITISSLYYPLFEHCALLLALPILINIAHFHKHCQLLWALPIIIIDTANCGSYLQETGLWARSGCTQTWPATGPGPTSPGFLTRNPYSRRSQHQRSASPWNRLE